MGDPPCLPPLHAAAASLLLLLCLPFAASLSPFSSPLASGLQHWRGPLHGRAWPVQGSPEPTPRGRSVARLSRWETAACPDGGPGFAARRGLGRGPEDERAWRGERRSTRASATSRAGLASSGYAGREGSGEGMDRHFVCAFVSAVSRGWQGDLQRGPASLSVETVWTAGVQRALGAPWGPRRKPRSPAGAGEGAGQAFAPLFFLLPAGGNGRFFSAGGGEESAATPAKHTSAAQDASRGARARSECAFFEKPDFVSSSLGASRAFPRGSRVSFSGEAACLAAFDAPRGGDALAPPLSARALFPPPPSPFVHTAPFWRPSLSLPRLPARGFPCEAVGGCMSQTSCNLMRGPSPAVSTEAASSPKGAVACAAPSSRASSSASFSFSRLQATHNDLPALAPPDEASAAGSARASDSEAPAVLAVELDSFEAAPPYVAPRLPLPMHTFWPHPSAPAVPAASLLPPRAATPPRLARAEARYQRLSPIKTRRVLAEIRGMSLGQALAHLATSPRRPAFQVFKTIQSALANAIHAFGETTLQPRIHSITANNGPVFKRPMLRARGRMDVLRRPTTHIRVILEV
ncbi:ribosomal protein RPL22 [Besnoitia besnoiti]|uniref:Ribosomal protein RPL22 n=1 Tax=Besnoitia besnoiti TaxID=94643 RepID=A0A2A9MFZ6_BESBE|nr:ribosomal protein RPL22 [Besnoitia besnoiti]PFH34300.1 ribosomal protein RPL22 [Besnoitia besnoiti]